MRPYYFFYYYLLFGIGLWSCSQPVPTRPNVVLILAEDISTDLSCYGRGDVKTPVLDSLAAQGELFHQAFTTSPVCSPSRSAIMTGCYQNSIGAHNHRSQIGPLSGDIRPFTHLLQASGYFTCNVENPDYGTGKIDVNFSAEQLFDGTDWSQRAPGQPFFAQVSIYTTHRDEHWYGIEHQVKNPVNPEKVDLPPYYPDHPVARLDWSRYLNSIQMLDAQVEKLIARLKAEGSYDDTIIIFMGDHGRCHIRGKQWLYDSGVKIPLIIKWVNSIRSGDNHHLVSAIDVTATILEACGLLVPDFMQGKSLLADDYVPRSMVFAARDRCDAVVDKIRSVRTDSIKYIRNHMPERPYTQFGHYKEFFYPMIHLLRYLDQKGQLSEVQRQLLLPQKPKEELYNLREDPYEMNNLANDPGYATIKADLSAHLSQWERTYGGEQFAPETSMFMDSLLQVRIRKYGPKWEARGIAPDDPPEVQLEWWSENLEVNKYLDNQPLDKPGADRFRFKVIGRDSLYIYRFAPKELKSEDARPAIVFFHGGGWRRGKSSQFDRQGRYLASRGMVVFQADYRVMMRDSISPYECVQDAKSAIRWVRTHAKELGVDPNRIAAGGGSAGGHLAAACAHLRGLEHSDENLRISSVPNALVLFNPVFDNGPNGYRYDLFGEDYSKISPVHNVNPGNPPALVMLGDQDENLSVESVENYQKSMHASGNQCIVKIFPGQKHGFFNLSKGGYPIYATTVLEMDKFLTNLGYLKGAPTISLNK